MVFITEGQSAAGSIVSCRDVNTQAIFALRGKPLKEMILTGLSLAFATIPEELPIIITMVLSLGAYRLSKNHAIVRRLNAAESLGSVTVIATDKTGTLTENRMQVAQIEPLELKVRILEIGALCNDAIQNGSEPAAGDPLDAALIKSWPYPYKCSRRYRQHRRSAH